METLALALVAAAVILALAPVVGRRAHPSRTPARPPLLYRRVTVHTRRPDDQTIKGVVAREERRPDGELVELVLEVARYVQEDGSEVDLVGEVLIPGSSFSFAQIEG